MTSTSKTLLGFDFGTKSIGVAIGQEITGTASPLEAIHARDGIPDWELVNKVYEQWQPHLVVVGLPLNMDGSKQEMTFRAQKFANRLHAKFKVPVQTLDERLTTVDAKARLFEMGGFKKLTKGKVDSASACLILESFMSQ
ncbi:MULTISPECIES: Holliday junction resolvase RuvX [Alteromonadaceae]|uniref:Holliday junction resolvase RuvX n=1 Tax=Alteromonadaceae TaxID=72275 RepID=UPI001C0A38C0|nr:MULTISPECIES: Holliday junction resolvase RuvX [Aliiglaciecola]MBU2876585.1 Holliday junction resolvase RuvX [Aliiglaciecola lipolytica]MDO6711480.1 Holliday junction resolvase RuvX [Aliiglaciecola sp. 2_MG-2023]MDO6752543.1 Holliday junction resolvase RuvX [Aliiglaciecola sp. 1_MG-2023]